MLSCALLDRYWWLFAIAIPLLLFLQMECPGCQIKVLMPRNLAACKWRDRPFGAHHSRRPIRVQHF